jgi:hypothetical protein
MPPKQLGFVPLWISVPAPVSSLAGLNFSTQKESPNTRHYRVKSFFTLAHALNDSPLSSPSLERCCTHE